MGKTLLNVQGMDCAHCATTITKTLEKKGIQGVNVNFATGEVFLESNGEDTVSEAVNSINGLGYKVISQSGEKPGETIQHHHETGDLTYRRFLIALIFTIPLVLHMVLTTP